MTTNRTVVARHSRRVARRISVLLLGQRARHIAGVLTAPGLRRHVRLLPPTTDPEDVRRHSPDTVFASGVYRKIPEELLRIPSLGFYGFHETDLPEGRGHAPLAWTLIQGRRQLTITLIRMTEEMDAGPYVLKRRVRIRPVDTIVDLETSRIRLVRAMLREAVGRLIRLNRDTRVPLHRLPERPQFGVATYNPPRTPADSEIDCHVPLVRQWSLLRACDSEHYPAFFRLHGLRFVILECREPKQDASREGSANPRRGS